MSAKLNPSDLQTDHSALLQHEQMLRYLQAERHFSHELIQRLQIGWVEEYGFQWLSFPIFGDSGECKFKKFKRPPSGTENQARAMCYPKNRNAMLYPLQLFEETNQQIVLCEGEPDTIAARSIGLHAFCGTAGARTFEAVWLELLRKGVRNKHLYVLYDNDQAGEEGMAAVLQLASETCPDWKLYRIEWPDGFKEKGDVTDFLSACTVTDKAEALLSLCREYTPPTPLDRLIESLATGDALTMLPPCQGIWNGQGYTCVSLRQGSDFLPFIVTSERDCFPCTKEEWTQRGSKMDREPVMDGICRWEQKQLVQFLKRESEVLGLADIIQLIREKLMQYTDFADQRCFSIVAIWIVMTYLYRLFPAIPYLHFTGLKGAGKTKMMQIISLLAFNGELVTSSASPASIIRLVHNNGATLGVDEAEDLWNTKDENSSVLQDVLRSGYKTGIQVTKCEKTNDGKQIVIRLDPFSPKALSGIQGLEDALSSRCIEILMLRTVNRKVANTEIVPSSSEWEALRALLYPAILNAMPLIWYTSAFFEVQELAGRNAELWKPLLLIAQVAKTEEMQQELLSYALELTAKRRDDESEAEIGRLLQCLQELLQESKEGFVAAENIFERIAKEDEFSWIADPKNKGKRGRWLNARLKRLGLWDGPAVLRSVHGEKKKGYALKIEKISKAMERFGIVTVIPSESVPSVPDPSLVPS